MTKLSDKIDELPKTVLKPTKGEKTRQVFEELPVEVATKPSKKRKSKTEKEVKNNKKNKLIAAVEYLEGLYEFRFNTVAQKTEVKEKGNKGFKFFDKRTYDKVIMDLKMEAGIDVSRDDFDSLIGGPMSEDYDPLKEFIFSIKLYRSFYYCFYGKIFLLILP